jgi:hypothetical protein
MRDGEVRIPCQLNPNEDCPPNCPNHSRMKATLDIQLRYLAYFGQLTIPNEDYSWLKENLKNFLSQGKPDSIVIYSCVKNRN